MSEAEPLRVAHVGLGRWGSRLHAELLRHPDFDVVALCDSDTELLQRAGGSAFRSPRLGDVLERPDVEAVVLALPPQKHGECVLEALEAGRHVFVEKPMALDSAVAARIVALGQARQRVVCVGHVTRYLPLFDEAARLLRAGALGKVSQVLVERVGARPRPQVGPWWVLAPHDLSFLLATFPGPAHVERASREPSGETHASLVLGEGVRAHLRIAGEGTPRRATLCVGERGMLLLDEAGGELRVFSGAPPPLTTSQLEPWLAALGPLDAEIRTFPGDALALELTAFFGAVRFARPLLTDAEDGYRVVSLLEAVDEAACEEAARAGRSAGTLLRNK